MQRNAELLREISMVLDTSGHHVFDCRATGVEDFTTISFKPNASPDLQFQFQKELESPRVGLFAQNRRR